MVWRFALILASGCFTVDAVSDDVLSRSQEVGRSILAGTQAALIHVAAHQANPLTAADAVWRSVPVESNEHIHVLAADGQILAGTPAFPASTLAQILGDPVGVGTYHAFLPDFTDVVRRDIGWSRHAMADRNWIVVVERDRPLARVKEAPLTGKWLGAYSYSGVKIGEEPVAKEAGPMSVLILQEGQRCQLHVVSQRWNVLCAGLLSGTNLTAAADSSPGHLTTILEAEFAPEEDKIRGTLHLSGSDQAGRATLFLQRVPR